VGKIQLFDLGDPFVPLEATEKAFKQPRKCERGVVKKRTRCVGNVPATYGQTRITVLAPGTYQLHIKPSGKALARLKKGRACKVRLTLVFTPAGTRDHISMTAAVVVHLKTERHGAHHSEGEH
jgi:hypothetical protein